MTIVMVTSPRSDRKLEMGIEWMKWRKIFFLHDVHKWVIGAETGKTGYRHWQIRLKISAKLEDVWTWIKDDFPQAHIEEASDNWTYECKERWHWTSEDRPEVLQVRFGQPRASQRAIIEAFQRQNDREIAYWCTEEGNKGKSWLCNYLWETCQAHYCPPYLSGVQAVIQFVASTYLKQGWRPFLVIDIPRSWKWSKELYTAIEAIKDGLIVEPRYEANTINIRGVKVLVLCNTVPQFDRLSNDRWFAIAPPASP